MYVPVVHLVRMHRFNNFLDFCFQNNFSVRIEDDNVSPSDVRGEIKGPDSSPNVRFDWTGSIGDGLFTPEETGIHRVI